MLNAHVFPRVCSGYASERDSGALSETDEADETSEVRSFFASALISLTRLLFAGVASDG